MTCLHRDYRNTSLETMFRELTNSPDLYQPSLFWQSLNSVHVNQLLDSGFDNFKRTVNMRYFNWRTLGIIRHQSQIIINEIMKGNFSPIIKSRFVTPQQTTKKVKQFNILTALLYRLYIASFFDYLITMDRLKILDTVKEPAIGNPFMIKYKGETLSQDLCNSIHEFYSIVNSLTIIPTRIGELGAGYGRLAYIFLKMYPTASYCIIDIPPALYIAQKYLAKVFPNENIFFFRRFTSFNTVKRQFNNARIVFLLPHQIELLPKNYFNLTINISSLHEMTRLQIKNYLLQINRLTSGYFYTKQWVKSRTKDNDFITDTEYPIPTSWKMLYKHKPHPVQKMFFDALYQTRLK